MADESQLEILKQGVATWNEWFRKEEAVRILVVDLRDADLSEANLTEANLRERTRTARQAGWCLAVIGLPRPPALQARRADRF
jgi:uncharacterized protein YjbI with pentapeptide repeats